MGISSLNWWRVRDMEDRLVDVLVRLVRLSDSLGDEAFDRAADRCLQAIGEVALEEAEANAAGQGSIGGKVVPFPLKPQNR